ncbi:LysR family transcriptional regulator [Klebsiella pneumoniae]|nr:LysR family transcriptional regulator [Klebsiella pneumoniae]
MRTSPGLRSVGTDLGAIHAFVVVAEAGSFVAGARLLGMTRSAASKAVARLEARLGVRLLHRTTRQLSLTADGEVFLEHCVRILQDLGEAEDSVRQDRLVPRGTLRLTVSEAYGRIVILPFLKEVLHEWPDLSVEVNFSDRLVDLVDEGFDLGIRLGALPADAQWVARPLARTRPGLYAAPDYLQTHGTPQQLDDLGRCARLLYGLRPAPSAWQLRRHTESGGQEIVIDGPSRLRFDSGEALHQAALAGMGIAFLPSFLAEPDVCAGRLLQLFPDVGGRDIPIHAVYPHRRHLAARVRLFIDRLARFLGSSP